LTWTAILQAAKSIVGEARRMLGQGFVSGGAAAALILLALVRAGLGAIASDATLVLGGRSAQGRFDRRLDRLLGPAFVVLVATLLIAQYIFGR
jgi:hypothetical protein